MDSSLHEALRTQDRVPSTSTHEGWLESYRKVHNVPLISILASDNTPIGVGVPFGHRLAFCQEVGRDADVISGNTDIYFYIVLDGKQKYEMTRGIHGMRARVEGNGIEIIAPEPFHDCTTWNSWYRRLRKYGFSAYHSFEKAAQYYLTSRHISMHALCQIDIVTDSVFRFTRACDSLDGVLTDKRTCTYYASEEQCPDKCLLVKAKRKLDGFSGIAMDREVTRMTVSRHAVWFGGHTGYDFQDSVRAVRVKLPPPHAGIDMTNTLFHIDGEYMYIPSWLIKGGYSLRCATPIKLISSDGHSYASYSVELSDTHETLSRTE